MPDKDDLDELLDDEKEKKQGDEGKEKLKKDADDENYVKIPKNEWQYVEQAARVGLSYLEQQQNRPKEEEEGAGEEEDISDLIYRDPRKVIHSESVKAVEQMFGNRFTALEDEILESRVEKFRSRIRDDKARKIFDDMVLKTKQKTPALLLQPKAIESLYYGALGVSREEEDKTKSVDIPPDIKGMKKGKRAEPTEDEVIEEVLEKTNFSKEDFEYVGGRLNMVRQMYGKKPLTTGERAKRIKSVKPFVDDDEYDNLNTYIIGRAKRYTRGE